MTNPARPQGGPIEARGGAIPTLFTDAQIQRPWIVEHVDIKADPQSVESDARTMLELAQSLTLESTRGNIPQVLFHIPLVDHGPLEKPGDEPKRRLWELKLTYGDAGKLEEVELSTGHNLQSIRVRVKTAEKPAQISYFGRHTTPGLDPHEDRMIPSQKNNHPLWIEYGKRKLAELVTAATLGRPTATIDDHPIQAPWPVRYFKTID